jgi:hypothetical protein
LRVQITVADINRKVIVAVSHGEIIPLMLL